HVRCPDTAVEYGRSRRRPGGIVGTVPPGCQDAGRLDCSEGEGGVSSPWCGAERAGGAARRGRAVKQQCARRHPPRALRAVDYWCQPPTAFQRLPPEKLTPAESFCLAAVPVGSVVLARSLMCR